MGNQTGHSIHEAASIISNIGKPEPALVAPDQVEPAQVAPEPAETTPEPAKPASEQAETASEPAETASEPSSEPSSEPVESDPEASPETAEASPETAPEPVEDIEIGQEMLAELLGLKENDLVVDETGVRVLTKSDGEIDSVPLKDLKASFQQQKTVQKRLEKIAHERKEFEANRDAAITSLGDQQKQLNMAVEYLETQYANDWKQVNWQQLREDDPDQYTLRRQDVEERTRAIKAFKEDLTNQIAQYDRQMADNMQQSWVEGSKKLDEAFSGDSYKQSAPWDDAEKTKLSVWMAKNGLSEDGMRKIDNWLFFKWARDAMLREQEVKAGAAAVRQVAKLPKLKVAKPGSKSPQGRPKTIRLDEAKAKQRKAAKLRGKVTGVKSNLKETTNLIKEIMRS